MTPQKNDLVSKEALNKTIVEIHIRALDAVSHYRRVEAELIDVLQKVEEHRVYLKYKCRNLYDYTMRVLKLTESVAFNFIVVARKAKEIPELKAAIAAGEISVSKARKITPVLTSENQKEWLQRAIDLPQRKLEQEVARANPQKSVPERMKYVSGERLNLQMGISEKLREKLKNVQDLESQRRKRPVSLEETLEVMAELYLRVKDPVKKAEKILLKRNSSVARQVSINSITETSEENRKYKILAGLSMRKSKILKSSLKYQVIQRDQGQCTYIYPDGSRCSEKRWLDIHHIKPKSLGGGDTLENLTTLCASHHRLVHFDMSDKFKQQTLS